MMMMDLQMPDLEDQVFDLNIQDASDQLMVSMYTLEERDPYGIGTIYKKH